jgi:hypothetical protein
MVGVPFGDVLHRRVVDRQLFADRLVDRDAAFDRGTVGLGGIMRFLMRTLAKVPRIMISWLPRREP